jgi:predicted transglutaminase-like cysteine proteinase
MKKKIFGLLALSMLAAITTGAHADTASLPGISTAAHELGEARPVLAWTKFCERYPQECTTSEAEPAQIALTPRTWQTIVGVNRKVNTSLEPMTDLEHWGIPDRWDLAEDGIGDCEDFQLLKRKLLADAGLPRRAMRMTVVIDEKGEGHAVLMIRTDRGDLILDNKTNVVLPWHRTGYIYVKREGQVGSAWVSLGGATTPLMTANR